MSTLARATIIGTVLQLAMVLVGHWVTLIASFFGPLGMLISLVAGGLTSSARDGAIAGGVCALIGIVVSYLLGDVYAVLTLFGTAASAVAGSIGGLVGRLLAARKAAA